ncbi:MAG: hypothetical protein JO131_02110, partial [Gammaproteobacteria bacterium]|nr:hypothetical protein [Gammaproteobacteria bacterium]
MPVLSTGQALLLLIKKYNKPPSIELKEPYLDKCNKLKSLYLLGPTEEEAKDLQMLLNDPLFSEPDFKENFTISKDFYVISEDPTRRYFETHLAYETLAKNISTLDHKKLENYMQTLDSLCSDQKEETKAKNTFLNELNFAIQQIDSHPHFHNDRFSKEDRDKLKILFNCTKKAYQLIQEYNVPLSEIYTNGQYFKAKNRGRIFKDHEAITHNFGILKSYMPVPKDDIAYAAMEFNLPKPSDGLNFDSDALWVKENFKRLVHPFVTSVSGTMLVQLRVIFWLYNNGTQHDVKNNDLENNNDVEKNHFFPFQKNEEFADFIKCFTSNFLYLLGGHSFYEFYGTVTTPEVVKHFNFIEDFKKINMSNLIDGPGGAFDAAIERAIYYNDMFINKMRMHGELTGVKEREYKINPDPPIKTPNTSSSLSTTVKDEVTHSAFLTMKDTVDDIKDLLRGLIVTYQNENKIITTQVADCHDVILNTNDLQEIIYHLNQLSSQLFQFEQKQKTEKRNFKTVDGIEQQMFRLLSVVNPTLTQVIASLKILEKDYINDKTRSFIVRNSYGKMIQLCCENNLSLNEQT